MIHVILINPCTDITSKCMWIYLDDLWLTALRMNLKEIKEFGNERMNVYERGCVLQCKDRQAVGSYSWMSNKDAWSFSFRCRKKKKHIAWHCLYPFKKPISAWKNTSWCTHNTTGEIHCHMAITAIKQIMLWTLATWIKVNCTVPLSSLSQWQYC